MSIENLNLAFSVISNAGGGDFEGPKSGELISAAEKRLGVRFPVTYRKFLEVCGCGDIEGIEIYGLINDNFEHSGIPDSVWITLKQRTDSGLPPELVLIGADGMGSYDALDTGEMDETGECPVVAWEPGVGRLDQIAADFGDYLLKLLRDMGL